VRGWPTIRSQPFRGTPPPPPPLRVSRPDRALRAPRTASRAPSAEPGEPGARAGRSDETRARARRPYARESLTPPTLPAPRRPHVASVASARPRAAGPSRAARSTAGRRAPGPLRGRGFASARRFVPVPGRVPGARLATARPLANRGALDRGSMFRALERSSVRMPEIAQDRRSAPSPYHYRLRGSRSLSGAFRTVCQCLDVDAERDPKPLILLRLPLACS
jgi:hypothetical protein